MTLALTSIVILMLAIPGFVARSTYFKKSFSREALPKNITDDIVRAIIYSIPFHLIAIIVLEHAHHFSEIGPDINFKVVFRLLSGEYGTDAELLPQTVDNIYAHSHFILAYFVFVVLLAFQVGLLFRRWVWDKKLDVRFPALFGYKSDWLYLLFGRDRLKDVPGGKILPYIDILVEVAGEKTRLYRGVVLDFLTDEKGALTELILVEALKGKFEIVKKGKNETSRFYWMPIPGNFFVIKYSEIKNLNITYVLVP